MQLPRDVGGLVDGIGRQQARAKVGSADPAPGIDARAEREAELARVGDAGEARYLRQRREAGRSGGARNLQALVDEGAVEPRQRDDVADGAEGDEVEPLQEWRLRAPREGAALAQDAGHRHQDDERHAHGGQVLERARLVDAVRVHDRHRLGQRLLGRVVVDDHDLEAARRSQAKRFERRGAGVEGDEKTAALIGQRFEDAGIGTVAVP